MGSAPGWADEAISAAIGSVGNLLNMDWIAVPSLEGESMLLVMVREKSQHLINCSNSEHLWQQKLKEFYWVSWLRFCLQYLGQLHSVQSFPHGVPSQGQARQCHRWHVERHLRYWAQTASHGDPWGQTAGCSSRARGLVLNKVINSCLTKAENTSVLPLPTFSTFLNFMNLTIAARRFKWRHWMYMIHVLSVPQHILCVVPTAHTALCSRLQSPITAKRKKPSEIRALQQSILLVLNWDTAVLLGHSCPDPNGTPGEGLHHNGTQSSEWGGQRGDAIPACSHLMAQTALNLKCKQNSEAANSDATDFGGHSQSSSWSNCIPWKLLIHSVLSLQNKNKWKVGSACASTSLHCHKEGMPVCIQWGSEYHFKTNANIKNILHSTQLWGSCLRSKAKLRAITNNAKAL